MFRHRLPVCLTFVAALAGVTQGCGNLWELPPVKEEAAEPEAAPPVESSPGERSSDEPPVTESGIWDRMFADRPASPEVEVVDPRTKRVLKERGSYLVRGPAACGFCHGSKVGDPTSPLSGGQMFQDRFGSVQAPNITPHPETGIGNWKVNDIVRALRASLGPEERPLSVDLHSTFRWISDADAKAIAVYLLDLPAVESAVERRALGNFERKKWGLFSQHREVEGYIPAPPKSKSSAYGRYMSYHVAGCYGCHTPEGGVVSSAVPFSGSSGPSKGIVSSFKSLFSLLSSSSEQRTKDEDQTLRSLLSEEAQREYFGKEDVVPLDVTPSDTAPRSGEFNASFDEAITQGQRPILGPDVRGTSEDGLAAWTKENIVRYLSSGVGPEGKSRDPRVCPWPWFQRMNDADKDAIAGFLKQQ